MIVNSFIANSQEFIIFWTLTGMAIITLKGVYYGRAERSERGNREPE